MRPSPLGISAPGAPAGMKLVDTMPTTSSLMGAAWETLFRAVAPTRSPYVALNVTWVPMAPGGER